MKITSAEIKQKTFTVRTFGKGYDRDEVAAFLLQIAQEWEILADEHREQKVKIELMEKEIQKLREVESSLFRTLKTAEDTSSNIIDQARRTADLKVQEAQNKADFILNDARLQARAIVQKAQARARQTIEEMVSELKSKERAYQELLTYRSNILLELKSFLTEAEEKRQRFAAMPGDSTFFAQKIRESEAFLEDQTQEYDRQTATLESLPQEQEPPIQEVMSAIAHEDEAVPAPSMPLADEAAAQSFFDTIK